MIAPGSLFTCAAAVWRPCRSFFSFRRFLPVIWAALYFGQGGFHPIAADTIIVNAGESINSKLKNLQPGDTLLVRAGTYRESLSLPMDGLPHKRIVLRAFANEKPVIASSETVLSWNGSWWLIQGLVFDQQGAKQDAIKPLDPSEHPPPFRQNHVAVSDRGIAPDRKIERRFKVREKA